MPETAASRRNPAQKQKLILQTTPLALCRVLIDPISHHESGACPWKPLSKSWVNPWGDPKDTKPGFQNYWSFGADDRYDGAALKWRIPRPLNLNTLAFFISSCQHFDTDPEQRYSFDLPHAVVGLSFDCVC